MPPFFYDLRLLYTDRLIPFLRSGHASTYEFNEYLAHTAITHYFPDQSITRLTCSILP